MSVPLLIRAGTPSSAFTGSTLSLSLADDPTRGIPARPQKMDLPPPALGVLPPSEASDPGAGDETASPSSEPCGVVRSTSSEPLEGTVDGGRMMEEDGVRRSGLCDLRGTSKMEAGQPGKRGAPSRSISGVRGRLIGLNDGTEIDEIRESVTQVHDADVLLDHELQECRRWSGSARRRTAGQRRLDAHHFDVFVQEKDGVLEPIALDTLREEREAGRRGARSASRLRDVGAQKRSLTLG